LRWTASRNRPALSSVDETIENTGADANGVNADHLHFPAFDELHREAGDFHHAQFGLDTNLLDVGAGAQNEDGSVIAKARDVDAETTLGTVRVPLALDGGLDQVQGIRVSSSDFGKSPSARTRNDVRTFAKLANKAVSIVLADQRTFARAEVQRRVVGAVLLVAVREVSRTTGRIPALEFGEASAPSATSNTLSETPAASSITNMICPRVVSFRVSIMLRPSSLTRMSEA
jgi:hypothetical protein